MCRNITTLRGLQPEASAAEIEAAARQYVRKVGGVQAPSERTAQAVEQAVQAVARATSELLAGLPARRQPPPTDPPLRRLAARDAGRPERVGPRAARPDRPGRVAQAGSEMPRSR